MLSAERQRELRAAPSGTPYTLVDRASQAPLGWSGAKIPEYRELRRIHRLKLQLVKTSVTKAREIPWLAVR
jgi:hypothetical protein